MEILPRVASAVAFTRSIPARDLLAWRKLRLIFAVKRHTLLSYARLSKLHELALELGTAGVPGSFVECGVWRGGSAGVLARAASSLKQARAVWLFDSWEGLPEPQSVDVTYRGKRGQKGKAVASEDTTRDLLFRRLKLSPTSIHLIKGWFEDSIPRSKDAIGPIALLHLDCDWYESVRTCLNGLYDQVVGGGFVIADDYGHWMGSKKAVDEFIEARRLRVDLVWTDDTGVYFRKPSGSLASTTEPVSVTTQIDHFRRGG